ncbi:MAG: protein translocase subunit SecF [Parcubacteria group bacterium]|nr:protein translocase subunit SecF [Parcubacteria group bacterium]
MFSPIEKRKIWFSLSATLVVISTVVFLLFGLKLGIDFTGGSLMELEFFVTAPTNQKISEIFIPLEISQVTAQPVGDNSMILRFKDVDEDNHQKILAAINQELQPTNPLEDNESGTAFEEKIFEEKRFDSIGPSIGQELRRKTVWAIIIVLAAIIVYVAWAFRKVSKPIASWKYGLIAVITLFHDIIITVGIFVILGKIYGIEVNASFVAALLTILGYSVNDTIVVFDRTRENLIRHLGEEFEDIVQGSVREVITRSINTSFTTLFVLLAIFIFGGSSVRDFILALIVGISIGTYSSIFLASPLLVAWEKLKLKKD